VRDRSGFGVVRACQLISERRCQNVVVQPFWRPFAISFPVPLRNFPCHLSNGPLKPPQHAADLFGPPRSSPVGGRNAALIERRCNASHRRYAGRPQACDDGGKVGRAYIRARRHGSSARDLGLCSGAEATTIHRADAIRSWRHDGQFQRPILG
jgi:hypothetical protein